MTITSSLLSTYILIYKVWVWNFGRFMKPQNSPSFTKNYYNKY